MVSWLKKTLNLLADVLLFFAVFLVIDVVVLHEFEAWDTLLAQAALTVVFIHLIGYGWSRWKARRNKS